MFRILDVKDAPSEHIHLLCLVTKIERRTDHRRVPKTLAFLFHLLISIISGCLLQTPNIINSNFFSISLEVSSLISGVDCISRKVRRGACIRRYFLSQVDELPEGLLGLIFLGMCCWPLRTPTALKSIFWLIIDPILFAFGQMLFLQSQLSHLLFVHLPYKAF